MVGATKSSFTPMLVFCILFAVGSAQAQEIWFAPQAAPPDSRLSRAVDFMELFNPDAPWREAASHVKVFKLYASYLSRAP